MNLGHDMVEITCGIENIRVFKNGDEITILHRSPNKTWEQADSLLTFTTAVDALHYEITSAVNRALSKFDWNQDFGIVFGTRAYRDAVMNVPSFLMGE